jgi:hypothetical protein
MLGAISARDWTQAGQQLLASKAAEQLPIRYGRLAHILLTGEPA